jgi:phosphoenolpyruvate synthase/pyruvate phosphate dikinase
MEWIKINEELGCNLFALDVFLDAFTTDFDKIGFKWKNHLLDLEKGKMFLLSDKKEYKALGKKLFEKIKNKNHFQKVKKKTLAASEKLFDYGRKLEKIDFKNLTNKQLWQLYEEFIKLDRQVIAWGMCTTLIELENELVTSALQDYFESKRVLLKDSPAKYMAILTTPLDEYYAKKEEKALLYLLAKVQAKKELKQLFKKPTEQVIKSLPVKAPKLNQDLEQLVRDYAWVSWGYEGPGWNKKYYINSLKEMQRKSIKGKKQLQAFKDEVVRLKKRQADLTKQLKPGKEIKHLIEVAKVSIFIKTYRKEALFYALSRLYPLQKEMAKRLNASLTAIKYMRPPELKQALLKGASAAQMKKFQDRFKHYTRIILKGKSKLYQGKAADKLLAKEWREQLPEGIIELKGSCACTGHAVGQVVLVDSPKDMDKMRKGDILVSIATAPDLLPAMKKAAAIITDIGGLTCHAAIVSRELDIPCVVGAKIATKVLKDGDVVNVDATHGVIRRVQK